MPPPLKPSLTRLYHNSLCHMRRTVLRVVGAQQQIAGEEERSHQSPLRVSTALSVQLKLSQLILGAPAAAPRARQDVSQQSRMDPRRQRESVG